MIQHQPISPRLPPRLIDRATEIYSAPGAVWPIARKRPSIAANSSKASNQEANMKKPHRFGQGFRVLLV